MNPAALTDLGKLAVGNPAWQAKGSTTFCNQAFATCFRIATGSPAFHDGDGNPYLANQIAGLIDASDDWQEVDYIEASRLANEGEFVAFYFAEEPHGHVCFGVPGQPQASGKYGGFVPIVANVGKSNGIMALSYAFSAEHRPKARVWKTPMR